MYDRLRGDQRFLGGSGEEEGIMIDVAMRNGLTRNAQQEQPAA